MAKLKILVVDDEPDTVKLLEFNLKGAGYDVISAEDGAEGLQKARRYLPGAIVLDIMLPEMDGLEVCKALRRDPSTEKIPVLMLTAKAGEMDRILGLELGANDYLTKPFSPRELLLRLRNLLKPAASEQPSRVQFDELVIDVPRHIVSIHDKVVSLTRTEFRLLQILIERQGRIQSRERLLQDVWKYHEPIDTRTVDTHMRRLREKLGSAARFLNTVHGVGYRFMSE